MIPTIRVLAWYCIAAGACAVAAPNVTDRAGLLGKQTPARLEEAARSLQRDYRVGLRIETVAQAPLGESGSEVIDLERENTFSKWLKGKAESAGKDTVYVLLVKEPPYLLVSAGDRLAERGVFTREDRNTLMHLLARRLRRSEAAKGMLEAVAFLRGSLSNRIDGTDIPVYSPAPPPEAPPVAEAAGSTWLSQLGLALIVIFGGWLAWNIYRAGLAARAPAPVHEKS